MGWRMEVRKGFNAACVCVARCYIKLLYDSSSSVLVICTLWLLAGKDVLTVATVIPLLPSSRHYMIFTRGDLVVHLSNTGTNKNDQIEAPDATGAGVSASEDGVATAGGASSTHAVLSCVKLVSLGTRWGHICTKLPDGEAASCTNVTQLELLGPDTSQFETIAHVDCLCRAGDNGMEACFGPGKDGEPAVFALE